MGEGTTITICLPRSTAEQAPEDGPLSAIRNGTVFLVEDNPEVADASTGLLRQLGYTVRWASDASAALMEIENNKIDIVCSDIVMPGKLDGGGLAGTIRVRHPKLSILLLTGYSGNGSEADVPFPFCASPTSSTN